MKNLAQVSNESLHEETLQAATNEKAATLILLEHLAEIDRRRLYAAYAYTSLWEYVHKALGYSEAQTSDRVNAMRVMVKVPEIKTGLEQGKLTLTSTAKLASYANREKLEPDQMLGLLTQVIGKSSREVEKVLISHSLGTRTPIRDTIRTVSPTLTRVTIEVTDEFMQMVTEVKNIQGHPGMNYQEVFALAMKALLKQHSKKLTKKVARDGKRNISTKRSRYISVYTKQSILNRSQGRCEFTDPRTQRRCESRSKLQLDHIWPFAKGGKSTLENLRHLCPAHNSYAAIQEYGLNKMNQFLK
jgi:hypothetical protein